MRLMTISFSVLALSATTALSGGGKVTSTGPGPTTLSSETTDQMLGTMGIDAAASGSTEIQPVIYSPPPPAPVSYTPPPAKVPATIKIAEAKDDVKAAVETDIAEAPAGPPDPRETIRQCSTCHGVDGIAKIPTAPNIAGSSRQYLETQLKAFRSGKRENEVMAVIAEEMTNAEIKAAAKWYASLKVTVEIPE